MSGNLQRIYCFSGLLFITMNLLWPLFENADPLEIWCIMPYTAYLWNSSQHTHTDTHTHTHTYIYIYINA
jgi:hypothetical protein